MGIIQVEIHVHPFAVFMVEMLIDSFSFPTAGMGTKSKKLFFLQPPPTKKQKQNPQNPTN